MEYFFDDLSKRIATAASRRDMLSITARTCFAAFLSSTGIGKLWASSTTTLSSSQVCPGCGTCQQCNTKAGKCGQDCEDPCTAAVLCLIAQQFPPYVTLQAFLATQFTSASVPDALVLIEPSVAQAKVLATTYRGPDPSVTAKLYFTDTKAGFNAYAVMFSNGAPQFGYLVAANGQLQQVLPPHQLSTAALATSTPTGITVGTPVTTRSQAAAKKGTGAKLCKEGCSLICGALLADVCTDIVAASCILVQPELALACILLSSSLCSVGSDPLCRQLCESATCGCPGGCGDCTTCSNGVCVPITCPSGYSCNSNFGACTCDNLINGVCSAAPIPCGCLGGYVCVPCTNCSATCCCPAGATACASSSEGFIACICGNNLC